MAEGLRKLIWAPQARRDLIDIWKYFAKAASAETADNLLRQINLAVDRVSRHPLSGRPRDDIGHGLRSILVHPHVVIYQVTDVTLEVARILHERQDIPTAYGQDLKP
jgi:toxin ParE1/3/4